MSTTKAIPDAFTSKTGMVVPISDTSTKTAGLIEHYSCGSVQFSGTENALYERHLVFDNVVDRQACDARTQFEAFARAVRDVLSQRWILTEQTYERQNAKMIYYLSMEFLLGRSLSNNVMNLQLDPLVQECIRRNGIDWADLLEQEPDAGLGNGGLGRLAACFLDSMATLQLPAMGYGLRYEYGIFKQSIQHGWQQEQPDNWLLHADPWEVARPQNAVEIKLNCSFELHGGTLRAIADQPSSMLAIPYDRPVVGYAAKNVNTLRLWAAAAPNYFDFEQFSSGDFIAALADSLSTETITRVLYPDDSTGAGQALRFVQQYFLVAASLADIARRFQKSNDDWNTFPEQVAVQLNDTHPALAVPELMRMLLDDVHLGWEQAWDITKKTLAYTNHTLLPEALEKWPVAWFEMLLPRHLDIIWEINQRVLDSLREHFPGEDARVARVSLVEEGPTRKIRMSNLAVAGSHSTNGVASLHSTLLRTTTLKDLADLYPERFNNKTNGVTPRRWLLMANPALAKMITETIGDAWITDLTQLERLKPLANDSDFRHAFQIAKREAKYRFTDWLKTTSGTILDPETLFDSQVKRIHEYKRQFLNALRIVVLYTRLRRHPDSEIVPRTFLFAGKAAPAYHLAKVIIKFINALSETLNRSPEVQQRLKVVFLPDYCVSLAEYLIPASDVSNQISTAGYEASGTSNMKFMMNGALTVGTRDGATIEMAKEAGEDNLFLFGLTAEEVSNSRGWYSPYWHNQNEPETREALEMIFSDHFSPGEHGVFEPLRKMLFADGDHYMHLADLKSYMDASSRVEDLYRDPEEWTRKAILNVASSGKFSSDRTIAEYATEIWGVNACPVH